MWTKPSTAFAENAGDIRREFYGRRYKSVNTSFSTQFTFSGYSGDKPIQLAQNKRAFQLADFKNETQYAEPTIRKEFKDTAFWNASVMTGTDGKATVTVPLPDNLTTWRATARAVTSDLRVGSTVGKVLSRKDLILRLETPRFLTEGDTIARSRASCITISTPTNPPNSKLKSRARNCLTKPRKPSRFPNKASIA
ncbi:MAG: alpha-2-macroglobulin family protein [Blastocatellia bacterium]